MVRGRRRHVMGLSALLVIALLGWWAQQQEADQRRLETVDGRVPDYYLKDFRVTAMNEQGRPGHLLQARSLYHYDDEGDVAEVDQPLLQLFRDDGQTWVMRSQRAEVYDGGVSLWLQGAVTMSREAVEGLPALAMETRDMWVYPEREYAESSAPVALRQGPNTTEGEGLRIDLKEGRVTLLSAVRGEYVFENR